ncbi:MAG TPA: site-specific DNA-methyltransferase [Clostridiales bacterium]|nr:site-specific DNA-methyltransferase [Clostridia bacterium]MDD4679436.1 site-specific DNA-methyltransferase [Clostridia bacterium]HCS73965.1 site-specific DNA-methyltransferase [Clostridiales bacterium]
MSKKRAGRNKTIDISLEQGQKYLERCIKVNSPVDISTVLDKTINEDTFEVVKHLPEKSIDLIIADPPYNLSKSFHGNGFTKKTDEDYETYTRQWLNAVLPLLKDTGSIYVCCDWESSLIIGKVLMDMCTVRNRITWQREKGRGAKANWKNGLEDIWYATKSNEYTFNLDAVKIRKKVIAPYRVNGKPKDWVETDDGNYRDTCPSNFWDNITIPFWSMAENTAHPTQKSEKLIAKIMLASSNEGDIVFDPFLGSGTTSAVSKKLGRHYIGIEENPLYCVWAEKRLEMAETDTTIQGYVDGVFWDRNTLSAQKSVSSASVTDDAGEDL